MRRSIAFLSAAAVLCADLVAACSSSSSGGAPGEDGGGADTGASAPDVAIDVIVNPNNCVKPGALGNAQGVGGYCSPGGAQCTKAGPGGAPTLCSADLGAPANAWFCTLPCPAACGAGAACLLTPTGAECVPTACTSQFPDGGLIGDGGSPEGGPDGSDGGDSGPADAAVRDARHRG